MDLYAENILDHFKHPRHKRMLTKPSVEHGEKNLSCGDGVHVQVELEGNRIAAVGWTGEGCAISQAAMSLLAEFLEGKTTASIDALTTKDVRAMLGVPVSVRRSKCAFLALHALKNLLHRHRGEQEQGWANTVAEEGDAP